MTQQSAKEFYGPLRGGAGRVQGALIALLALTATALVVISYRHQQAQHRHAEELRRLALRDELTGLNNRRGFLLLAEHEMAVAKRNGASLTLLFIDIDNLKQINDDLGHVTGDAALVAMAEILRGTFRESDVLARFGGDEFCALLTGTPAQLALRRLARSRTAYNNGEHPGFTLSFSTGVTTWAPEDQPSLQDVVAAADRSMYARKRHSSRGLLVG